MIPSLLAFGIVTGAVARPRVALLGGGSVCLLWGIPLGVADGRVGTFLVGTALAGANVLVGLTLGLVLRRLWSRWRPASS